MSQPSQTYTVDGVKYGSLEEMPAEVRRKVDAFLADRNGDGIPDLMQDFTFASVKPGGTLKLVQPGAPVAPSASAPTRTGRPAWLVPAIVAAAVAAVVIIAIALN